jgi:hypothetical protein
LRWIDPPVFGLLASGQAKLRWQDIAHVLSQQVRQVENKAA